jgi:hypothetical protein
MFSYSIYIMNSNDFSNYIDKIENTNGIYTGFVEELPYDKDGYLDIPKTEDADIPVPIMLKKKTRKNKKKKIYVSKKYPKRKTIGSGPLRKVKHTSRR